MKAKEGDTVLTYCPRSSSLKHQGIFSECVVVTAPRTNHPKNIYCSGYARGGVAYAELALTRILHIPLAASEMKKDPILREAVFLRKNFQGTTFPVASIFYTRISIMINKLNLDNEPETL